MHLKKFQEETIEKLRKSFLNLWKTWNKRLPLVLKSPTWSWKTIMTAEFLRQLVNDPQMQDKKAYVWITFSEELYSQSKKKLFSYYDWAGEINLLDLNDLSKKRMKENNVFFINWQKIRATNKDWRKLRKETEHSVWDKWVFDEFILNTKKDGIELILIIDEAQSQTGTALADEIVDLIDPRIIFKITATPKAEDIVSWTEYESFVNVKHEDVIKEWLIKEKIITQTKEDIEKIKKEEIDQDKFLIELAFAKREELKKHYETLWLDINPLVLIQLPNDDKQEKEALNTESKLDFVKSYLKEKWVKEHEVAIWLSEKKENLELVEKNNSPINFLIFKQAAATGWDCPRASILLMFREVKNPSFHIQTVWRILRMPLWYHFNTPELNVWYLYTNYNRNDVIENFDKVLWNNKPAIYKSSLKPWIEKIKLDSIFIWRRDYNTLWPNFEKHLFETLNDFFEIDEMQMTNYALNQEKLKEKWIDISLNIVTFSMIADIEITHFDHFIEDLKNSWIDINTSISLWDLQRMYDLNLYNFISQQEIESRKYAPAKSWKAFKNAINTWWIELISEDRAKFMAILVNDFKKENSILRNICGQALETFKPIREKEVEEKEKNAEEIITLYVPRDESFYTNDYVLFNDFEVHKSALIPFYLKPNYPWRANEVPFIRFVEEIESVVWWYKNWDSGREYFAIKYFDTLSNKESLFYPDFIAKLQNGKILIVDTKDGQTASSEETKNKAEWLQKWSNEQKDLEVIAWIVVNVWWIWMINNNEIYNFDWSYSEFKNLDDLI